ncbi:MAG: ribonuclease HI family protein [Candidatus Wildermuthbacteria bacterium]|nr:ribonuclease HI family protein [Candidatus Wildermuthbacteria bacterium]
MNKFIVYTDGGARGNPGPAAIGVVIKNEKGQTLKEYGEYIGETTNNEAEYRAAISALKKIKSAWGKESAKRTKVLVCADSELLVKQASGQYKIEHPKIQQFFLELWNAKVDFAEVLFKAVPREQNKEADRMVNQALDQKLGARSLL